LARASTSSRSQMWTEPHCSQTSTDTLGGASMVVSASTPVGTDAPVRRHLIMTWFTAPPLNTTPAVKSSPTWLRLSIPVAKRAKPRRIAVETPAAADGITAAAVYRQADSKPPRTPCVTGRPHRAAPGGKGCPWNGKAHWEGGPLPYS
jgi:UDP-glucose 6-dehydrogenase